MLDLNGAKVLVVGGSAGIGEAVARLCCDAGAEVTIAARRETSLAEAKARLSGRCNTVALDVLDDAACERVLSAQEYDHIVVTAAPTHIAPIKAFSTIAAQAAMDAKFWGSYRVARYGRISAGGSLTLVSGAVASRMLPGRALMAAITAAVETLTKGLALDLAPVRVNAVSPAFIETDVFAAVEPERLASVNALVEALPVRRRGQPEEVGQQIISCMTNGFMTGTVIYIDGGFAL